LNDLTSVLFWLLDINHEVEADQLKIRLWGKDQHGRSTLVVAKILPYFYLLPKKMESAKDTLKMIEEIQRRYTEIDRVESTNSKYFGKPIEALRITCATPEKEDKCTKLLSKLPSIRDHLEDDIRPATRYIIENDCRPSGWYRIDVSEIPESGLQVEKLYETKRPPEHVEKLEPPTLKMLALSVVCLSERGSPDHKRDPILAVTLATDPGQTEQLVSEEEDDRKILAQFVSRVQQIDPDIIIGYGQNSFDWPYLIERSKIHKIKLAVDRSNSEPHRSLYGHISVTGRANIDMANVSEDIQEVKVKTLGSIAEFLQIADKAEVDEFLDVETGSLWRNREKRKRLLEYSKRRAKVSLRVARLLIDSVIQTSNLTGLPLDQIAAAAVGFKVDSYLMMQAPKLGELIPRRTEQPYIPYQGAIVLEPKPGIHDNVAVLDFTSMYPNLMILHNLSPDTYVDSNELPKCKVMIAPEVGFKFRKSPAGFYKIVLENLISIRSILKNKLSQIDPNSPEHRVLKEREKAIKVITNACYGYAGWVGARWYVPQVAQAAAAYGRATLRRVFKIAEGLNLSLIYADTDAIFVEFDQYKVKRLLEKVEAEMKMEITVNKVYSRVLFTEAKKKYAGLLPDGTLDIVGLEVVRGDWSNVAKTAQGKVLELVLKEKNAQNAVMYLREFIRDLRLGRVRLSDLAIWKTLTKPVESYKVKAPHVEVARALLREGWNLKVGDKVGFVIVKGAGRLYEKAKPYNAASLEQVDLEYYVTNQILPAALRILGMFGIDESTALGDPKPSLSSCLNSP